jgi:hypothetical protein
MYDLTISTGGQVLRSGTPVAASRALKDWFQAETTGYEVTCHDENGASVTKAQLRTVARHALAT